MTTIHTIPEWFPRDVAGAVRQVEQQLGMLHNAPWTAYTQDYIDHLLNSLQQYARQNYVALDFRYEFVDGEIKIDINAVPALTAQKVHFDPIDISVLSPERMRFAWLPEPDDRGRWHWLDTYWSRRAP